MPPPSPSYSTLPLLDALGFPRSILRKQDVDTYLQSYLVSSYRYPISPLFPGTRSVLGFFTYSKLFLLFILRLDESRSPSQLLSRFYSQTLLSRKTERLGVPPLPHFSSKNTLNQKKNNKNDYKNQEEFYLKL
jgi:hypothetical protein